MKYYLEETKKFYETEEEANKALDEFEAEKKVAELKAAEAKAKAEEAALTKSAEKKAMAKAVEDAEKQYTEACDAYQEVMTKVDELREEYENTISALKDEFYAKRKELLDPANKKIQEAASVKRTAVIEFNKKYGPYTKKVTGEEAVNEMNRAMNYFNDIFKGFWF